MLFNPLPWFNIKQIGWLIMEDNQEMISTLERSNDGENQQLLPLRLQDSTSTFFPCG